MTATPTTRRTRTKRDGTFAEYVYERDGQVIRRSPREYFYCSTNGGQFSAKPSSAHPVRIVVLADDQPADTDTTDQLVAILAGYDGLDHDDPTSPVIDWDSREAQVIEIPNAKRGVSSNAQTSWAASVRREAKRRGVQVTVSIAGSQRVAHVRIIGTGIVADAIAATTDTKEATVPGTTDKPKATAKATTDKPAVSPLGADLLAKLAAEFGPDALIVKKGYVRIALDKKTPGYVNPGAKALRVDVPKGDGHGSYDQFKVTKAADMTKAIAAMRKVAK